jgi:hypothetical protein
VFSSFLDCVPPLLGNDFMNKISSEISATFRDNPRIFDFRFLRVLLKSLHSSEID